jgi:hypothetical protein
MRGVWISFVLSGFLLATCGHGQGKDQTLCALYVSCVDGRYSLSECIYRTTLLSHLPKSEWGLSVPVFVALLQNASCVMGAGSDCDRVLSCLNGGAVVRGCNEGSRCADATTLSTCVPMSTSTGDTTAEVSISCADLGLECIVLPVIDGVPVCAKQESETIDGMEVTCEGNVAHVRIADISYRGDCGIRGTVCRPGSYVDWQGLPCVGSGPACSEAEFEDHCVGNKLVTCLGGTEARLDCGALGLTCQEMEWNVDCSFPGCDPYESNEQCQLDSILYCGPRGPATISCTDLGFSGCTSVFGQVRCEN